MKRDDTRRKPLSANHAITPVVLRQLHDTIEAMPSGDRPNFAAAQCVLRHLARWCREGACADAVSQIANGTMLSQRMVRRSLDALEAAGIARAAVRGGGTRRVGTRRVLFLDWHQIGTIDSPYSDPKDPVDNEGTPTVQTVGDQWLKYRQLRPSERSEIDENSDHNSDRIDENSVRIGPNSDRLDGQHRVTTVLSTVQHSPQETCTPRADVEALAGEVGKRYAIDEKSAGAGRDVVALAKWKREQLLSDSWALELMTSALEHAETHQAWSNIEIDRAQIVGAVLAGSIDHLVRSYPAEAPRPALALVVNDTPRAPKPPVRKLSAEERHAAMLAAGLPSRFLKEPKDDTP